MALIHCDFFSESIGLSVSLTAILPQQPSAQLLRSPRRQQKYQTLWLLHGLSDDHTIWQRRTSIERYVDPLGLAVIMPAVHRSFYTDMANGYRYWTFVSEELPLVARSFFPLSMAREDNFVAGLSMGGYGAFKLALRHPDRYAAAASLSGKMDVGDMPDDADPKWLAERRRVFGDLRRLYGGENDLFALAERVADSTGPKPQLYQCCGTEDGLYAENMRFRDHAQGLGLDLTYEEHPADHVWAYWDQQIQRVLEWLPLRKPG